MNEPDTTHEPTATPAPPPGEPSVIGPGHSFGSITDKVSALVLSRPTPRGWYVGFTIGFALVMTLTASLAYLLAVGTGIWGINVPVAWGFAIINFVWWIGIGHAGTLISAVLLLLRQRWRTSINRFAEAMTLFAVACAGIFPLVHMGRPWFFYWLAPYPNTMALWPQFRSAIVWDVFAVSTYFTVSLLFWYVGLIPDLATLRDRARGTLARIVYGVLAMGWRGSARHWHRYEVAYLLLAGLATPLVVSVHTVVSFDFATSVVPGWHSTIFPPYFVAGAIFSGFAMVLTLTIPIRAIYGLQDFITDRHLQNMAKVLLATGLIVAYGYAIELFMGWYSGNIYEQFAQYNRVFGPYALAFWGLILCNVLTPQLLWSRAVRSSPVALWFIALVVNVGMWLERFVIVMTLHRDFLPSSWGMYAPTFWDWATFLGTIGLFLTLLLLFIRFLPMISIFEMRTLLPEAHPGHAEGDGAAAAPARVEAEAAPLPVPEQPVYGLLAEFRSPADLARAARAAHEAGYTRFDAYSPFPVEDLGEAMGVRGSRLPLVVFLGGLIGCVGGFLLQYYAMAINYPLNVGGRPLNSWPAFIPVTFELTILCASLAAVLGMLAMNGLPRPHHPLFAMQGFDLATRDRFFLCIESRDPRYDPERTRDFLAGLGPHTPREVPL